MAEQRASVRILFKENFGTIVSNAMKYFKKLYAIMF